MKHTFAAFLSLGTLFAGCSVESQNANVSSQESVAPVDSEEQPVMTLFGLGNHHCTLSYREVIKNGSRFDYASGVLKSKIGIGEGLGDGCAQACTNRLGAINKQLIAQGKNALLQSCEFNVILSSAAVKGVVDAYDAETRKVKGWACKYGNQQSIDVHLYLGGPAGQGFYITAATANLPTEGNVSIACATNGVPHRFAIPISAEVARIFRGKPIFVHAIDPVVGNQNYKIAKSGAHLLK